MPFGAPPALGPPLAAGVRKGDGQRTVSTAVKVWCSSPRVVSNDVPLPDARGGHYERGPEFTDPHYFAGYRVGQVRGSRSRLLLPLKAGSSQETTCWFDADSSQ